MPVSPPSYEALTPDLRRIMEYVAKSPGISNRVLETHGFTRNQAYLLAQKARVILGITTGVGNAQEVYVDSAKFAATCTHYHLKGAAIPADGVVVKETVAGIRTAVPERQHSAPAADASYPAPVVPPAPAPVIVATVPTTEVPPEVLAAAPPRESPPALAHSAPKDVKELVQLLRLAMVAENIERLTITKDALTFRRIVVEEGEYDV